MQMSVQTHSSLPIQVVRPAESGSKLKPHTHTHQTPNKPETHTMPFLPDGKLDKIIVDLFASADSQIELTLRQASAKHLGAQSNALVDFHNDISNMTQQDLDEMKDTIVRRMGSDESSQWDRNLLQRMYNVTDAVAEHRDPGLKPIFKPGINRIPKPHQPGGGCFPVPHKPDFPQYKIPKMITETVFSEIQKAG